MAVSAPDDGRRHLSEPLGMAVAAFPSATGEDDGGPGHGRARCGDPWAVPSRRMPGSPPGAVALEGTPKRPRGPIVTGKRNLSLEVQRNFSDLFPLILPN